MSKTRVIFAGTPEFAKVALQTLIDKQDELNIEIAAVYTQPDRKAGRGQKLTASPVKELALAHGIAVEQPVSFSLKYAPDDGISGQVSRETLANYRPDVMVVAAYGLILPLGVLNTPTFGCLNIHASLLPRWRGAAPIQRAILAGDTTTGVTIMQMAQGLDTGDMLYKAECPIEQTDTTQSLHDKLAALGGAAITAVLADLVNYQKNAEAQDENLANYAEKIAAIDGQINWQENAFAIQRQIRALNAYSFLNGERVKVLSAMPIKIEQITHESAGKVVSVGKNALLAACGADEQGVQHLINITGLQWAGGKPFNAEQIANSNKVSDGDYFTNEGGA
ncbi:methionyl-tRNA formyltransferase [Moraxella caviae]|uniref:Methionyl-tRNA formyltransferase n=1 Tax=Moraxella caviae TaxID=34060 RepID=A0A1S9ZXP1_9GAMM|nr:methionyl-tRNA formyltransferase [Moraxella caviae]OOR88169.1 methionyl-tRNA formyltransferase [Moraxella caviae]STZ10523.1 Methionyl-tRNA formyltransferase [Moraxella caviae]